MICIRVGSQLVQISGSTVLLTGATGGIGHAIARAMGARGAKLILTGRRSEVLEPLATELDARALSVDLSARPELQRLIGEAGDVDILVANAGLQRDSAFHAMTLDEWNKVLGVNLTGQFLCARAATREFLRRGVVSSVSKAAGKIICMSSVHQVIPWAGHANYATSKGGIKMMMESMAQELAPQRIRVNGIAPGAIQTPINTSAWNTPEALKSLLTLIPYGRIGQPEDIARAAVWLASDDSDYVVGTTLFVDGGMTLYPGFATGG